MPKSKPSEACRFHPFTYDPDCTACARDMSGCAVCGAKDHYVHGNRPQPCKPAEQPPEVPEPQEGASTKGVSAVDRTAPVGGAPSCDSAELAAIQLRDSHWTDEEIETAEDGGCLPRDRRALLHMVDELTNELKASRIATDEYSKASLRHLNQRDELRAKLSDAEQRAANTVARADANEVRAQQLEAKLAEAETHLAHINDAWDDARHRAEAARASLAAEEQRHHATECELLRQVEAAEARVTRLWDAIAAFVKDHPEHGHAGSPLQAALSPGAQP